MKYLGFNPGRFGDLYMSTVAARALKYVDPNANFTFVLGSNYKEAAPLFINHPHIDRIHILDKGSDGFNQKDIDWINSEKFNYVFNPMSDHDHSNPWWKHRIQPHEVCHMHGIPIPPGDSGKINMTRWFDDNLFYRGHVAISPFPAWYAGINNDKALSIDKAQGIVSYIINKGHSVIQLGAPEEPELIGATKIHCDYFQSVKNILGCKLYIGGDSGMTWLLSGYDFPVLALYGHRYYGQEFIKNIQPINPNGMYLDAPLVNDIPDEEIFAAIDKMLS